MMNSWLLVFAFLFVSLILLRMVYLFLKRQHDQDVYRIKAQLQEQRQAFYLPSKLEAYQRLILLLERLHPSQLTLRVLQVQSSATAQQTILLQTVRDEFEHNIAQQLFVSEQAWSALLQSKEEVIRVINMAANTLAPGASSTDLGAKILEITAQLPQFPTEIAAAILREEFRSQGL
ncbi:MAG: hypothetical protein RLZZ65_1114 [Bacteroidota bacterium]|jgi:hypothetical protein